MRIVIVGAGGFGREILDTIKYINRIEQTYEIVGFIDNVIQKGTLVHLDGEPYEMGNKIDFKVHHTSLNVLVHR